MMHPVPMLLLVGLGFAAGGYGLHGLATHAAPAPEAARGCAPGHEPARRAGIPVACLPGATAPSADGSGCGQGKVAIPGLRGPACLPGGPATRPTP